MSRYTFSHRLQNQRSHLLFREHKFAGLRILLQTANDGDNTTDKRSHKQATYDALPKV